MTEAAALGAARWIGRGDKIAADQAAVDGMRAILDTVTMAGVVVIGEGEKDEAPMLYNGEEVGERPARPRSMSPSTRSRARALTATGQPNAIAVIAVAERGTMFFPGAAVYMDKIAAGAEIADAIDIDASPAGERPARGGGEGRQAGRDRRRRPRARAERGADRRAARVRREGDADHGRRRRTGDRGRESLPACRPHDGHRGNAGGRDRSGRREVPGRSRPGPALAARRTTSASSSSTPATTSTGR